jgi:hypothetical protein
MNTPEEFGTIFARLREVLQKHASGFQVGRNTPEHFSLDGNAGPATLRAWGGKRKSRTIPVAWVQVNKSYVSYHLMGVCGNPKLLQECSTELRSRMQGKSCFNFSNIDESLIAELDLLTHKSLASLRNAGYVTEARDA